MITAQIMPDYDAVSPPFTLYLLQTVITLPMLHSLLWLIFLPPNF